MLLTLVSALTGCIESKFTLDGESRLPRWFTLGEGVRRSDVSVTITYYTPDETGEDALVELVDSHGRVLSHITGQFCWHPSMAAKRNKHGGFHTDAYPMYGYVRTKKGIEVLEHRVAGPLLWVSDDPLLRKQAEESTSCNIE